MRLRLILLVLAAAGTLAAGEVRAQVRFSIGGSGWSVGNTPYGYGGWGYGYGGYNPYYYGPPARNYYYYDNADDNADDYDYVPQPQATYRQARTPPKPYAGPGVTVRNPAGSEFTLTYLLDDQREQEISAGETQKLTEKGSYVVSFDRGGEHGIARYTISEGLYEFTKTDHGWELYRQRESQPEKQSDPKVKANPLPMKGDAKPAAPEVPKPRDAEPETPQET